MHTSNGDYFFCKYIYNYKIFFHSKAAAWAKPSRSQAVSSDGQGFQKPWGYAGMGTEGMGQGMDLKTLEKPVP